MLAQALYAATQGNSAVQRVLGPALDLLVWIPKKVGAETVDGQRPLQLPPCLHRLFGMAIMEHAGHVVAPLISVDQAAVRGGSCGTNLRAVTDHLAGGGDHRPVDLDLW